MNNKEILNNSNLIKKYKNAPLYLFSTPYFGLDPALEFITCTLKQENNAWPGKRKWSIAGLPLYVVEVLPYQYLILYHQKSIYDLCGKFYIGKPHFIGHAEHRNIGGFISDEDFDYLMKTRLIIEDYGYVIISGKEYLNGIRYEDGHLIYAIGRDVYERKCYFPSED